MEIRLQGATYFVIFSDADELPPPYRIDNLSEVRHDVLNPAGVEKTKHQLS